jgi:dUTP pyrophosphatase
MSGVDVEFRMLDAGLPEPRRARRDDAGWDLYAAADATLPAGGGPVTVGTGVAIAIPPGWVGLVCSRSGLAAKRGIAVLNAPGVVDPGYRGELKAILYSIAAEPQTIRRGDRVAQLLIVPAPSVTLRRVDTLPATERGQDGLGSTGT